VPIPSPVVEIVEQLFATPPTIAVLGAHPTRYRAAFYVPDYLHDKGATILPVNPGYVGETLFGVPCLASLAAAADHAGGRLDAVVVFRASAALPGHLDELLAVAPKLVWFQQGISHDDVAEALRAAGTSVVQDRCLKVDHARVMGW